VCRAGINTGDLFNRHEVVQHFHSTCQMAEMASTDFRLIFASCYPPSVIGLKDEFESLRTKLRMMSEVELLRFGRELRKRYEQSRNLDRAWRELQLAREEWRSRHPKRRR